MAINYYRTAKKASLAIGHHAGLLHLSDLCQAAGKVLDVGCGEGTRLNTLLPKEKHGWGIDPSKIAITKAQRQYPKHHFRVGVGEKLPYSGDSFDLVYSAFAIEHCSDPEKFIAELVRVCRHGGHVVILAPNYGAPNRRSPNSIENPYNKFFEGLIQDFFPHPRLNWHQVTPQETYSEIDADTTWEPYLLSLIRYLRKQNLKIVISSSLWNLESKAHNLRTFTLKTLGTFNLFPVTYWGPQVFISAVKYR